MRARWRVGVAAVVVTGLLGLGGGAPALAQPVGPVSEAAKDLARKNYRQGEAKFNEGNWAAALALYEQAEATIPIPVTKYKIAFCHDRLGHTREAVRWYKAFLDASPPAKMADAVAEARTRLAALDKSPGQIRIAVTPPTAAGLGFSIDGAPPQAATPSIGLPPGHHRIVVSAQGFAPVAAELDLSASETKDVRITLPPLAAGAAAGAGAVGVGPQDPPPPDYAPRRRSNVPAYVLLGVAGAGVVVGSAFGAMALKDKSNFNAQPTTAGADKTGRDALVSDVAFAAAVACGATGLILLLTNLPRPQDVVGRPFVMPYAGPTGGGATLDLTF